MREQKSFIYLFKEDGRARETMERVMDSLPVMLIFHDPALKHFRINREFERVVGWPSDRLYTGEFLEQCFVEHERENAKEFMRACSGGWRDFELRAQNGVSIASSWTTIPVSSGFCVSAGLDIRARKDAELSLQRSEREFRALAENVPDAVIRRDRSYRYLYVNPAAGRMLGKPPDKIIGKTLFELGLPKEVVTKLEAATVAALESGEPATTEIEIEFEQQTYVTQEIIVPEFRQGEVTVLGIGRDITSLRAAERVLKESEHYYGQLIALLPVLVWTCRADGFCDFLNDNWTQYTGLPAEEHFGTGWMKALHPDDQKRVSFLWEEALSDRAEYSAEYRLRRHDGEYRWFKALGRPIVSDQGKILKWFGTCTDIQDQKTIEHISQESHRRLEEAVLSAGAGYYEHSSDLSYVRVSPKFAEIFGSTPEDMARLPDLRQWLYAHVHEEDRERASEEYRRLLNGSRSNYNEEFRIVTERGQVRWVRCASASVERDGSNRIVLVAGLLTDITELHESAQRSALLAQAAHQLLTAADPSKMVADVFQLIAAQFDLDVLFNYLVDEEHGEMVLDVFCGISAEDAAPIRKIPVNQTACGVVAATKQPLYTNIQNQTFATDPKTALLHEAGIRAYACFPLMIADRILGTLGFGSRGREEFSVQELEFFAVIDHYVAVAKERLEYHEALKRADQRKDQFLATLAHELRNPLAPIRSALQLMNMQGVPELTGEARRIVERQLNHLIRLVDDLLDVSRIGRGKIELRKERIELGKIIESAIETSRPHIEQGRHELIIEYPNKSMELEVDPVRVAQAISNILINAAKYTPEPGQIRLGARSEGGQAVIEVSDNGIGLAGEMIPKIFEIFAQPQSTRSKTSNGLGIGLAISRMLIGMHGGTIKAESNGPGRGSTFTICLPLASEAATEPAIEVTKEPTPVRAGRRVLVVDDNQDAAEMLALEIRTLGYETVVAYSGHEALEKSKSSPAEIGFLDIGMPGMDGYEVARQLHTAPRTREMVLVALTGYGQEEDKEQAKRAGFQYHLVKPADIDATARVLE